MSILEMQLSRRFVRFRQLLGLNAAALGLERLWRRLTSDEPRVFYRYRRSIPMLHPAFRVNYSDPPLRYASRNSAALYHWWAAPDPWWHEISDADPTPFVLEPIDHVFSPALPWEPREGVERAPVAHSIYADERCRRILLLSTGQLELFRHYFPEFESKYLVVPQGCRPVVSDAPRARDTDRPVFLCVASSFRKKGVDVVVEAWTQADTRRARLLIVCPDTPPAITEAGTHAGIEFIHSNPPVSDKALSELYRAADVAIIPHHTEALNAYLEAIAHALPMITMRGQHASDFLAGEAGIECPTPVYFYDVDGYGVKWKTWEEFFHELSVAKKEGRFAPTLSAMSAAIEALMDNGRRQHMSERSAARAHTWFHIDNRNELLRAVYAAAIR